MKEIKPPKNFTRLKPKCCGTCMSLNEDSHGFRCERPDGPWFDEVSKAFQAICDFWMKAEASE